MVEHRHVERLRFSDDAAGASVGLDGLEFGSVGMVGEILARAVVDDFSVEVDQRDAYVFGDPLDAVAKMLGLTPEHQTGEREPGQHEGGRQKIGEDAFRGMRR